MEVVLQFRLKLDQSWTCCKEESSRSLAVPAVSLVSHSPYGRWLNPQSEEELVCYEHQTKVCDVFKWKGSYTATNVTRYTILDELHIEMVRLFFSAAQRSEKKSGKMNELGTGKLLICCTGDVPWSNRTFCTFCRVINQKWNYRLSAHCPQTCENDRIFVIQRYRTRICCSSHRLA